MNRIVILLGLGVAAIGGGTVFALSQKPQAAAQSAPASPAPAVKSQPAAASPASSVAIPASFQFLKITSCNGRPAHANFRQSPNFSPSSILGVVAIDESVKLTGRTTQAEGERWHESVNVAPLHPTPNLGAQDRLSANQVGWIAACFIRN